MPNQVQPRKLPVDDCCVVQQPEGMAFVPLPEVLKSVRLCKGELAKCCLQVAKQGDSIHRVCFEVYVD